MASYLALITVRDEMDNDEIDGMRDALGAVNPPEQSGAAMVFLVPGEAPDAEVALSAATQHAGEILDGYDYEVEVSESV
ncbi:hypothetical protein [Sanguibacter antarcticus]|nr:hypothetical protein [Sanguibacter antarcticus]